MVSQRTPSVLITGANRGLGLALAAHYLSADWRVFAACRKSTDPLDQLATHANLTVHRVDVTDENSINELSKNLDGTPIDVLINNAGISGRTRVALSEVGANDFMACLKTNAFGPLLMSRAFVSHVARSDRRIIANISSRLGSIEKNDWGSWYVYGTSKTVLNRISVQLARTLEPKGITVTALHPGWVSTDMGGAEGPVTPQQSALGLAQVIDSLSLESTGHFYDYTGAQWPW